MAVLALGASVASAANYHSLKISLVDQSNLYVDFDDEFNLSFTPEEMKIVTSTTELNVPRKQIVTLFFSEEKAPEDGVRETEIAAPSFEDGRMIFESLPSSSQIIVTDAAGHSVLNAKAEGSYVLDLSTLGKGIFIVNVNNSQTYKLNLK